MSSGSASSPARILVVCTGNICRSPVVERLLQERLSKRGAPAIVRSAGTHGGLANNAETVKAAMQSGLDISDHVSRLLTTELIRTDGADLIITMSPQHTQAVVGIDLDAWERTFSLPELLRRAAATSPEGPFAEWVSDVGSGRTASEVLSAPPTDEIPDPIGRSGRHHRAMVSNVTKLVDQLVEEMPRDF